MYRLHTREKAARRFVAIVAAAICLLVAVAMALVLIQMKRQAADVPVGERVAIAEWPMSLRVPREWMPARGPLRFRGLVASFREPPRSDDARSPLSRSRTLYLMRREHPSFQPPISYCTSKLAFDLRRMVGLRVTTSDVRPAAFGPLAGAEATVRFEERPRPLLVARVGCSPTGEVYIFLLESPWGVTPGESRLLGRVVESIELTAPVMSADLSFVARRAGIEFALPEMAWVVQRGRVPLRRVSLCSAAEADHAWSLEIAHAWVSDKRPPTALIADHLRAIERRVELSTEIREMAVSGREVAEATLGGADRGRAALAVWAAGLGDGEAVLLVGRSDSDGAEALRRVARGVIATVRLRACELAIDMTEARERGKEIARSLRRGELERLWGKAETDDWYLITLGGEVTGFWRVGRRWVDQSGEEGAFGTSGGYQIVRQYRREVVAGIFEEKEELWQVTADGDGHRHWFSQSLAHRKDSLYDLEDVREPGALRLSRRVQTEGQRDVQSYEVELDETFVCDPVAEVAALVAAEDSEGRPASFTAVSLYSRQIPFTLVYRPAGRVPLSGEREAAQALAVVMQSDYDPRWARFFFDARGRLVREEHEGGLVLVLCSRQEVERAFPGARIVKSLRLQPLWRRTR